MIMLKHKQSDSNSTLACSNCLKNSGLIKKYEQLIRLYKKKQVRLSTQMSSQMSIARTPSITLQQTNNPGTKKIILVLESLYKRRCCPLFRSALGKSAKKFVILNLANRIQKYSKAKAFFKLKKSGKNPKLQLPQILSSKLNGNLSHALFKIREHNGISSILQLINQTILQPEGITNQINSLLQQLKISSLDKGKQGTSLARKNMELQIINKNLIIQNQTLRTSLEQLAKRQAKQNSKKRESLQMLAEQISEKNQQIIQLKRQLKAYEETYEPDGNVLGDDRVIMRQEIDHLQKIRQKLNNDVQMLKSKLQQTNKKLKTIQQNNTKLTQQINSIRNLQHESKIMHSKAQKLQNQFTKLMSSVSRKIKRLNTYQKQLQSRSKSIIDHQQNQDNKPQTQIGKVEQQIKSQLILLFLANIADMDYKLRCQKLFDEEEKNLLYEHKDHYIKLQHQQNIINKIEHCPQNQRLQLSGIQMKGTNGQMDSIFYALESPRDMRTANHLSPMSAANTNPSPNPHLTMKMLELQLQKNKQIEKISELKQKFLHLRMILLRLLKSLEMQPNIKTETMDILRVLFDLFQYSQEERDSIWVKKKRMFGFLN